MAERVLLCVDDDTSVLHALQRSLRKEDYRVLLATGGQEGLDLLADHTVQVVLSDQRMPGMEGTAFLQQVKLRYPGTIRVMLSGYADVHAILESINKGEIYRFLPKPWNDDELKRILRQCFDQHDLMRRNRETLALIRAQNETLRHLNETLEHTVREQTHALAYAREVVDKLPVAVLGIDAEGLAALANDAARRLLAATRFSLGAGLDVFLPPEVHPVIYRHLGDTHPSSEETSFTLNGRQVHARIIGLNDNQTVRGCLLLIPFTVDVQKRGRNADLSFFR